jgi:hypothetical protein
MILMRCLNWENALLKESVLRRMSWKQYHGIDELPPLDIPTALMRCPNWVDAVRNELNDDTEESSAYQTVIND